jgi:hypothetical protein
LSIAGIFSLATHTSTTWVHAARNGDTRVRGSGKQTKRHCGEERLRFAAAHSPSLQRARRPSPAAVQQRFWRAPLALSLAPRGCRSSGRQGRLWQCACVWGRGEKGWLVAWTEPPLLCPKTLPHTSACVAARACAAAARASVASCSWWCRVAAVLGDGTPEVAAASSSRSRAVSAASTRTNDCSCNTSACSGQRQQHQHIHRPQPEGPLIRQNVRK